MTNRRHFCLMWILLLLGLGLSGCGGNDDDTISAQFSERTQRELETTVGQLFQELGVPGMMVGLWVPNVGKWTRAYGVSNRETGEPMHFDQHVRIGSVTKTFTVTLILQLQDAGLLNINDTLDQYFDTDPNSDKITLAQPIPNADRITLKNLANMTSGLASYTFDPAFQDAFFGDPLRQWHPLELVNIGIANTVAGCPHAPPACFEPGTDWFYNNTNTVMLGLIVEKVAGKPYAELLRENILEPLKLRNTLKPTDNTMPAPVARGYTFQGLEDGQQQDATDWNPSWGWGVGDLVSTFDDLRVWGKALGRGDLIAAETQALRQEQVTVGPNQPGMNAYAIGMGYKQGWWGHGGELPGYNTLTFYRPDLDAVVVVITNSDELANGIHPAYRVADVIIDLVARESPLLGDFGDEQPIFIDDSLSEDD
ncbi:MAG: serine hydrolase domain-containing protein [Candidatus Competibacteraceae bacterium]|nr:serine hydrolase domain-containing protein [Candidatus Competibacteraceae bacterium]